MGNFEDLGFQAHESGASDKFAGLGFTPHGPDETPKSTEQSWGDKFHEVMNSPFSPVPMALKALPTAGMIGGGIVGGTVGSVEPGAGTAIGGVAGAAAGAGLGKSLENMGEKYLLGQDKTMSDVYGGVGQAALEGAGYEMGGQILGAGAKLAADTHAGQYVLRKAGQAAEAVPKWAAQKVGKIFGSIPEETTARYIQDAPTINNALPREEINNKIIDLKNNADDQLAKAQEELVNAKGAATDKKQAYKEALKNTNLTEMTGNVHEAIGNLKDQVIKGSSEAYGILENSNGKVNTQPLVKILQDHIDSLHVNGTPKSPSSAQAVDELRAYQQNLAKMGTKKIPGPMGTFTMDNSLSMPEAKQVLQGLDKTINWKRPVGSFAPETDQALSSLRTAIDQDVKGQVPEYAQKMSEVSRKSRLLNAATDNFGTPEKAISNLNNIDSQKGSAVHLPIIEALGTETGKDLSTPVNDFVTKQKILSTPSLFEKMLNETPEFKKVSSAQASVDSAKSDADLFKGVTTDSITGKTKALNGANSYGAEAKFGPIDERYGTNFKKQIQARNDADQFVKSDANGSRKAVLGTGVGAGIGYAVAGKEGAFIGGTVGGQAGGILDKYSGPIFKKALDFGKGAGAAAQDVGNVIKMSPSITGQGASSMVPSSPSMPAAASSPDKGPDKWAHDGLQNLKQHVNEEDKEWLEKNKGALLLDPKAKNLLVTGSSFPPGSKPLDDIMKHLKGRLK